MKGEKEEDLEELGKVAALQLPKDPQRSLKTQIDQTTDAFSEGGMHSSDLRCAEHKCVFLSQFFLQYSSEMSPKQ